VSPSSSLAPNAGNDRSWVLTCEDFSDEALETTKCALKFKDADAARAFAAVYDAARETNAKLLATGGGGGGAQAKAPAPAPAAAAKPAADASGPVPVTDKLVDIYGAALENEAIVRGELARRRAARVVVRPASSLLPPFPPSPPRCHRARRSATAR